MPLPDTPTTLEGGCNCRAVRYKVSVPAKHQRPIYPLGGADSDPPIYMPFVCTDHCNDCRRATGALLPFWLLTPTDMISFSLVEKSSELKDGRLDSCVVSKERWRPATHVMLAETADENTFLSFFASSPTRRRSFCSRCGTMISFCAFPTPDWLQFPMLDLVLGTFDRNFLEQGHLKPERQLHWAVGIDWVQDFSKHGLEVPVHLTAKLKTMNASRRQYGFTDKDGVDWSKYVQYRPIYPTSFFERLFKYHAQKPGTGWSFAHDVGAGAGICSESLSHRFEHLIVSDPNDYIELARRALTEEAGLPQSRFTFLQESAENSSVRSSSVDLIVAAECVQWTNTTAMLEECHRQLKVGGTLLVSYYTRARLPDHKDAERAWDRLFPIMRSRAVGDIEIVERAFDCTNSGLASLNLPEDQWESVKRVFINTRGRLHDAFFLAGRTLESKMKPSEDVEWLENVREWNDRQGIDWLKSYISTYIPRLPEGDVQEIWDEIEVILDGSKTLIEIPVAMVLATKRGSYEQQ